MFFIFRNSMTLSVSAEIELEDQLKNKQNTRYYVMKFLAN